MSKRLTCRPAVRLWVFTCVIGLVAGSRAAIGQAPSSNQQRAQAERAISLVAAGPDSAFGFIPDLDPDLDPGLDPGLEIELDLAPSLSPDVFLEFDPERGVITVRARNVPRRELIETISRRCGIELVDEAKYEDTVSLDLQAVPTVDAIRRVLHRRPFVLRYLPRQARTAIRETGQRSAPVNTLWLLAHEPAEDPSLSQDGPGLAVPADRFDRRRQGERARFHSVVEDLDRSESTEVIAATAMGDPDPALRQEAIHRLGELGDLASRTILEQALLDPDRQVRKAAIDALTQIGDGQSSWSLSVALDDADPGLRRDAVHALGEIGDEIAIGLLRRALVDQTASVREAASEALAEVDQTSDSPQ